MNEQTITVHDGHKKNPTVLNRAEYDALCASGMMWEFHPDAPLKWPFPVEAVQPTATATPRTDALIFAPNGNYFSASTADYRDLCRTLERELSSAQAALTALKAAEEALKFLMIGYEGHYKTKPETNCYLVAQQALARIAEARKGQP